MVSEKNRKEVETLKKLIDNYSVIGIIDMCALPAAQLQGIKNELKKKAIVRVSKKKVINRVLLGDSRDLKKLIEVKSIQPAVILSNEDPFKLYKILEKSKVPSFAKAGTVIPKDIIVPSGDTNLAPGPIIGELQKVGIKAKIKGNVISVKEDSLVAKAGDKISEGLANVLSRLDIKPIKIGLNVLAIWEKGVMYDSQILTVDEKGYINKLQIGFRNAFNLSINISYVIKDNIEFLMMKAHNEAMNLALNAEIMNKETIKSLMQKAHTQAKSLSSKMKYDN